MAPFEQIASGYFAALALAAWWTAVPPRRRALVSLAAAAMAALVWLVAQSGSVVLRIWMPHLYLVVGYWLPALGSPRLVQPTRFEEWLAGADARLRPRLPRVAGPLADAAEVAYLMCYPLVPALFAIVWILGSDDQVTRFWVAVLAAGYGCYATLPWLLSRPPRLVLKATAAPRHVGAVNVFVLSRVSHELNTFPSGHVAIACAAAAVVATVSPLAGAVAALAATGIAVGAAAGGYHYVMDVLLGLAVAVVAIALAALWPA